MKITDFGYNGEGVGKIDGKVVFVPYTLTGEEVEIKLDKETSSFIKGSPTKIIKESQNRETPPCPYFAKCGGCDFQHMSYLHELGLKKQILERQLKKLNYTGDIQVVSSCKEYGYRNKIKLFCSQNGLGLKKALSDDVVPIDQCMLISDEMNALIKPISTFICRNKLQKSIDTVTIRTYQNFRFVKFHFLRDEAVDFTGLSLLLGEKVYIYKAVKSEPASLVYGKEVSCDEAGLTFTFNVDAFRQVNDKVACKLYSDVCNAAKDELVLNAYSGAGLLSAMLAKTAKEVYGIELGSAEHFSAQALKEDNEIDNLTNLQGDCGQVLPNLDLQFDCIVLDPPRSGCSSEVCLALNFQQGRIIYVSCNPATFVRDVQRIDSYELQKITLYDMFPRTANFEIVGVLEKKQ